MYPLLTFAIAISILVTASMFFPCFLTSDVNTACIPQRK